MTGITFSNGHFLDFACASGALAFSGKAWPWEWPFRWLRLLRPKEMTIVAKTVTYAPRVGNLRMYAPWRCVWPLKHGAVNSVGLTNKGFDHWVKYDYPTSQRMGYKVAASVYLENYQQAKEMSKRLNDLNLAYVEINLSCPNVGELMREWRDKAIGLVYNYNLENRHPLVLKMGYQEEFLELAQYFDEQYKEDAPDGSDGDQIAGLRRKKTFNRVEAFHFINTIPWHDLHLRPSPLARWRLTGGVSGRPIFRYALATIESARRNYKIRKPIVGGGGVWTVEDCHEMVKAGANAISIGTLFLHRPWEPNRVIRKYRSQK